MSVSDEFIESVREWLAFVPGLRDRRMFGGVMIWSGDLPFALIADDTLYLRTDEVNRLLPLFKPYPDKPATMPYGEVPPEALEDPDELARWVGGALEAARRAAERTPKRK